MEVSIDGFGARYVNFNVLDIVLRLLRISFK